MQELLIKIWEHYFKNKEFPAPRAATEESGEVSDGKGGKGIHGPLPPLRDPESAEEAKRAIFYTFYEWRLDILGRDFEEFMKLLKRFNENDPEGRTIPLENVQKAHEQLPRNGDERSHVFFRIFHLIIFPVMDFYPEDFCWANIYWPWRLDKKPSIYCFTGRGNFWNRFCNRGIEKEVFCKIAPSLAVWLTGRDCPRARALDVIKELASSQSVSEDVIRYYFS